MLGARAKILLNPDAKLDLAVRLRNSGAPLGEVFSFISGLYFRGKLAYAERFGNPPPAVEGVHIITASAGLLSPREVVTPARLKSISAAQVDHEDQRYRQPLDRDAFRLKELLNDTANVVLLGSIATPKYVAPLLEVFGERLLFPTGFLGRGDMSRGGLLLRSAVGGASLKYGPVLGTPRRGKRPPRLEN